MPVEYAVGPSLIHPGNASAANKKQNYIQSLTLPVLLNNSELWFYSCTDGERTTLTVIFTLYSVNEF